MSAAVSNPVAEVLALPPPSPKLAQAIFEYRAANAAIDEYNGVMIRNASKRPWTDEEIQHALSLQDRANAARQAVHRLVDAEYIIARPEQRAVLRIADSP